MSGFSWEFMMDSTALMLPTFCCQICTPLSRKSSRVCCGMTFLCQIHLHRAQLHLQWRKIRTSVAVTTQVWKDLVVTAVSKKMLRVGLGNLIGKEEEIQGQSTEGRLKSGKRIREGGSMNGIEKDWSLMAGCRRNQIGMILMRVVAVAV
uniref:Uncharacterized protein n=1 Tax=Opuntia streptacantha TaxID=393608 RepID=A0A7C9E286_OPUST